MWTYTYETEKNGYQVFLFCGFSVLGNKAICISKMELSATMESERMSGHQVWFLLLFFPVSKGYVYEHLKWATTKFSCFCGSSCFVWGGHVYIYLKYEVRAAMDAEPMSGYQGFVSVAIPFFPRGGIFYFGRVLCNS